MYYGSRQYCVDGNGVWVGVGLSSSLLVGTPPYPAGKQSHAQHQAEDYLSESSVPLSFAAAFSYSVWSSNDAFLTPVHHRPFGCCYEGANGQFVEHLIVYAYRVVNFASTSSYAAMALVYPGDS